MSDFTLEKNVPIPAALRAGRKSKYPWASMEVGDSFFVPGGKESTMSSARLVAQRRHEGCKFEVREVQELDEDGGAVTGLRVWRTV